MKSPRAIQFKAFFLLATFSMNTVVGFACSMGVDMGFNSKHHSQSSKNEHEDADNHHEHDGNKCHSHHHSIAASYHHAEQDINKASFSAQCEENCCKDFVAGFNSLDKQLAKQNSTQAKIAYLLPFISAFIIDVNNAKGYVQHLRIPPREIDYSPPDIRVFIQSFLI